jgi:hypothetical protein
MVARTMMVALSVMGAVFALLVTDFHWYGWAMAIIAAASGYAFLNMPEVAKRESNDTDLQLIQAYESDDIDAVFAVIKLRKWLRRYS